MKRIALSLALGLLVVASAQAQQAPRVNDAEPMAQAQQPAQAPRDHAAEAQAKYDAYLNGKRSCLAAAGVSTNDYRFKPDGSGVFQMRDSVWKNPAVDKAKLQTCL